MTIIDDGRALDGRVYLAGCSDLDCPSHDKCKRFYRYLNMPPTERGPCFPRGEHQSACAWFVPKEVDAGG